MTSLEDKVAIVTGASSGIGEATAWALAQAGVKVALAARRKDRLGNLNKKIGDHGGQAFIAQMDVTKPEDWQATVKQTLKKWKSLDILINNAGVMLLSFMDKLKVEEWMQMIDINVKGVLHGIAAVLPLMREQKRGDIINISSDAAIKVFPGSAIYSGTKAAVNWISEGLRSELAREKMPIRVTSIMPGAVTTELASHITDRDIFTYFRTHPPIEFLQPDDIAATVLYALQQPGHVDVNQILVRPSQQAA
ncbi:SDR family oxidoreductase [candidate division KSB1 bacterium]|nr:SDR family oxidoreductase [candidate division KSB1 bacterium]